MNIEHEESTPAPELGPVATVLTTLIGFGIAFALFLVLAAWKGIVLAVTWNWFVSPVFESAPVLDVPQAIGLALVVGLLTTSYAQYKDHEDATWESVKLHIMRPAMVLIMGWLIRLVFF